MKKQKRVLLILAVIATLVLSIIAVVTAIRLQQIGTQPVAPSVPKSKPKAQETNQCQKSWTIAEGPSSTPTPTGTLTPTPTPTPGPSATPGGGLACTSIDLPGGTSRTQGENIRFLCHGSTDSSVTQCRFRFGDGSVETFSDSCNVLHSYASTGSYNISCEVKDSGGNWHAASSCAGQLEIVSGPTSTPTPGSGTPVPTAVPTVPQQQLPSAGGIGQTIGVIVGGVGVILLGLLMLL